MKLTVKDVQAIQKGRQLRRHSAFDAVLEQCCKRIQQFVEVLKQTSVCIYEVPEVMIGYPLYNLNECTLYVIDKLEKNGFKVAYVFPRYLIITWPLSDKKETSVTKVSPKTKTEPRQKQKQSGLNLF